MRLANGRQLTALEIQREYLTKVTEFVAARGAHNAHVPLILDLWERTLDAIESGNTATIDTEVDWAIKEKLMDNYRERHGLELDAPRIAQLDLTYHDISRSRGLFYLLQSRGAARRVVDDTAVKDAVDAPPQTTRAKLRGDFVRRAQELGRDYTVDWVHLKLNDRAHQTILCKDPFRSVDDRVDALLDSMG